MKWGDLKKGDVVHHVTDSSWLIIKGPRPYGPENNGVLWLEMLDLDTGITYIDTRMSELDLSPAFWLDGEGT